MSTLKRKAEKYLDVDVAADDVAEKAFAKDLGDSETSAELETQSDVFTATESDSMIEQQTEQTNDLSMAVVFDDSVEETPTNSLVPDITLLENSATETADKIASSGKSTTAESNVRVIPKKIKHPSSSWVIFSLENREKIHKDQPSLTFTEGKTFFSSISLILKYA